MSDADHLMLVAYVNKVPPLLSLLYDMDLMPEQVAGHPKDEEEMRRVVAVWHRASRAMFEALRHRRDNEVRAALGLPALEAWRCYHGFTSTQACAECGRAVS